MKTILVVMYCFRMCEPQYIVKYDTEEQCVAAAKALTRQSGICVAEVKK